jgi:ABC-type transport system involved in multi-copper enzyme maturation permease subunit
VKLNVSREANPIVVKELRSRMRGWRAFAVLTGVLLLLGAVSYLLYRISIATTRYSNLPLSPQIGQVLFMGLVLVELVLICFITPAVTAGSISSEQEKQTYEMLLTTPLRPASILWGKMLASMGYVFLLIFAAVPMASLVFIFGGISARDMVKALAVLVALAVTLGVIGLFFSALMGRTTRAMVMSYLAVLAFVAVPIFAYVFVGVMRQAQPPGWLLIPNPVSALFSTMTVGQTGAGISDLMWGVARLLGGSMNLDGRSTGLVRPLYHYTLALYGALSLVLYLLTTRLVQPVRRWRIGRKALLAALAILLLFGGVVAAGFLLTAGRYEWSVFGATPTPSMADMLSSRAPAAVMAVPGPVATAVPRTVQAPGAGESSELTVDDDDLASIYTAVARQLYVVDHTFEKGHQSPAVYILATTDDSVGDPDAPRGEGQVIPEGVRQAVSDALADDPQVPATVTWVESRDQVPMDDKDTVEGGGAIFTLGNPHFQTDGTVHVSASVYFANLGAGGRTYILQEVDGEWRIIGTTGVEWMS